MPNSPAPAAAHVPSAPHLSGHAFHIQGRALAEQTVAWFNDNGLQIAIAGAIAAGILVVLLALRKLGAKLCGENAAVVNLRSIIGRVCQRTTISFLVLLSIRLVDGVADAPPLLDKTINFAFTIGFTIQIAFWLREIILGFVEYRAGLSDHDNSALGSALGIIRLLVTLTIFSLATVIVLDNLGVNVTGLIAGLGIGGIAIGFAAQGIFKDLFAALAIIFDRPFRQGDSVKWNNISGTVEAIGLKTTRIRAVTGEQVIVGNANLLEKEMFNLARLDRRRIVLTIAIPYETPTTMCEQVPAMLHDIVDAVAKCVVVRVGLTGLATTGIQYELQFDVKSANYSEVFDARSQVCLAILRRFHDAAIGFSGADGKALPSPPENGAPAPPAPLPMRDREGSDETAP
jgi:small-conductance mechanosensitive channel